MLKLPRHYKLLLTELSTASLIAGKYKVTFVRMGCVKMQVQCNKVLQSNMEKFN